MSETTLKDVTVVDLHKIIEEGYALKVEIAELKHAVINHSSNEKALQHYNERARELMERWFEIAPPEVVMNLIYELNANNQAKVKPEKKKRAG